jgi:ribosomal protein S18 acetylase RimI-like enzyme
MKIILSKLIEEDSKEIALIHQKAFPGFFLTELGFKVLQVFYKSLIKDDSIIAWSVSNENGFIGFFVATKNTQRLYFKIFIKNFHFFFIPLLTSFFLKPYLFFRMITSFNSSNNYKIPIDFHASLLSICVHPDYSGIGLGKLLIEKLENELLVCDISKYYLTTDADNNDLTNKFYLKLGFISYESFYQGKRKMNVYLKNL